MRFRRVIPFYFEQFAPCSCVVVVRLPHPRIQPREGVLQFAVDSGQAFFVRLRIMAISSMSHSVSMCSSDSVVSLQCGQIARIS